MLTDALFLLLLLQTTPGFFVDGNVVRNVFSKGPADRAGLRKGDVIHAINNLQTASSMHLRSVDSVLRDEGSNASKSEVEMQDIVGKLGMSRTRVKYLTANLEGDVAAILSRQRSRGRSEIDAYFSLALAPLCTC